MIQSIHITSRDQWLDLRRQDVTASVVTAARGQNPWVSKLQLYREKTGAVGGNDQANAQMEWGLLLENLFPRAVQTYCRPDWKISPAGVYLRDPELRIGATPDFFIDGDPRGRGVLQAKTTSKAVFEQAWMTESGEISVPDYIVIQTLCEMMMAEVTWGAVAVLIVERRLRLKDAIHVIELDRHPIAEAAIKADVAEFWQDVAWGIEPEPDAKLDARLFGLLYPTTSQDKRVDLSCDNYLPVALAELEEIKARIKADKLRRDEIETELKFKMGDAELATLNGFIATLKEQSRPKMVADNSQPRTTSRVLRVKDLRPKEIANGEPISF